MTTTASQLTKTAAACLLIVSLGIGASFLIGGANRNPRYDYQADIEPILIEYCFDCHGDGMDKGGVVLDEHVESAELIADYKLWEHVYNNVEGSLMPPGEKPQPSDEQRQKIAAWIETEVFQLDPDNPDPGRVTIRRLNREEYNNTIRDLVGVDIRPADDFPADDTGYGYDTIGDVLSLSPALLERYFDAAGRVLDAAMVTEAPTPGEQEFNADKFRGRKGIGDGKGHMSSSATVGVRVENSEAGDYRIEIMAGGSQAKKQWPIMRAKVEGGPQKDFRVDRSYDAPGWFVIETALKPGERWLDLSFMNDEYDPKAKDPTQRDRNLKIFRVRVTGPLNQQVPPPSEVHLRLLAAADPKASDSERAKAVISGFSRRAYRRPLRDGELDKLLGFFDHVKSEGRGFDSAVKLTFQVILVSPKFLFRGEVQPEPDNPDAVHPIDEHALASRLSYFLWSSMPDAELMSLADRGELRDQLDSQIERMLTDPRAEALTRNFAGQWLQLRNLDLVSPDPQRFKSWNDDLRDAMRGETEHFFAGIVAENRSVLEFIDADYAWLNETLAGHYGIAGIEGSEFRKVALSGSARAQRGGVLTHGSILTITSNPTRTSAVNRGKWVLENLLGTPPPPPPDEVPALEEAAAGAKDGATLSLRRQLELHRTDAACAACHERMDPLGFGLENFSAVGAWRDTENGQAIDASGKLYTGESFNGPGELRSLLAGSKREAFVRCIAEAMLTYALGRGLDYYDKPAVKAITAKVLENDYRFHALVRALVDSVPFQMRRGDWNGAEVAAEADAEAEASAAAGEQAADQSAGG